MKYSGNLPENTPILVGAGQVVERGASADSPMMLAAEASRRALAHAGGDGLVGLSHRQPA